MRLWTLLIFAAAAALALGLPSCGDTNPVAPTPTDTAATARRVADSFYVPLPDRIPSRLATNPGTPWGDYLGSGACKRCHVEEYEKWRQSFHSRTLYDAVEGTVFGDFSGDKVFEDPRFPFVVEPFKTVDPATGKTRFFMKMWLHPKWPLDRNPDSYGAGDIPVVRDPVVQEVIFAFGNRRHQPYVFQWEGGATEGRYYVAPVFWNDAEKEWRYDGFRPYVKSCASCHVTGIKWVERATDPRMHEIPMTVPTRYTPMPKEEGWADGSVGCEVCHGPGMNHVREVERMGVDRYRELLASGKKPPTIYDGKKGSLEHRARQCGQCHDFMTESTVTWVPGPFGFSRDPRYEPIQPRGGQSQFYGDGSHKSPCSMVAVYSKSKMWQQRDMEIGCTACHDAHGNEDWADLTLSARDNSLCLSCHSTQFPDEASTTRHSRHAAGSSGNRCIECHMPRHMIFTNGVEMMSDRIHSHVLSVPTGGATPEAPPTSCNVCHRDRSEAWSKDLIDAWWREDRAGAKPGPPAPETHDPPGGK
jgi:predicted CXXCH cytochrome family protein